MELSSEFRRRRKRLRRRAVGVVASGSLSTLQRWLAGKPPEKVDEIGARFGRLIHRVVKKRRERALSNLELVFPEMPVSEREALALRVFEHFGRVSAEFLAHASLEPERVIATTDATGMEYVDEALKLGRGALLLTGHFGNWERGSAYLSSLGYRINVVIRSANDDGVDQLVNRLRGKGGAGIIPRGNAAKLIFQKLRANELVAILPDQNAEDAFIPFFGHPAGTNLGPGVIHERTGAPVIPSSCLYVGAGRCSLTVGAPLVALPGYETKGEGLMRAFHTFLESVISQNPEQWLWFHDRWRRAREAGLL
ncbi:MAG: lysophospholipid acyltransferase family protein [Fimbriimonadaceae bacterium]|nr:lysophospholipid acyltransferase family protein [Fimbriimonadaceae bacterium]QYK56044.1 MAG: lysophospholipid acyltransferase family protein [Fimbriimonadaceae bacterium]